MTKPLYELAAGDKVIAIESTDLRKADPVVFDGICTIESVRIAAGRPVLAIVRTPSGIRTMWPIHQGDVRRAVLA